MRGGSKSFILGILLILFFIMSNGIQIQGVTWVSYGSMYGYTEKERRIYYNEDGKQEDEFIYSDSFKVWNLDVDGDKLYFRTNFTPYFMGLEHFNSQEEYDTYLAEHYLYDNETDSIVLAYSVIDNEFLFLDVLGAILAYNATISDFDIRLLYQELYGLFLPVNHQSFNFETDYLTILFSELPTQDAVCEQKDNFVLDKMKYSGYYISVEYIHYNALPDYDARYEYRISAMYSSKGELYHFIISSLKYNADTNKRVNYFETSTTLDTLYRVGGVKNLNFDNPTLILCSLFVIALIIFRRKK